jgi:hypothetical protein
MARYDVQKIKERRHRFAHLGVYHDPDTHVVIGKKESAVGTRSAAGFPQAVSSRAIARVTEMNSRR